MRRLVWIVVVCLSAFQNVCAAEAEGGRALAFAVHPYAEPAKLVEALVPLVQRVDEACGTRTTIVVSKDYQSHGEQIVSGAYDYFYIGSAMYVTVSAQAKIVPLAQPKTNGEGILRGAIVAPVDSPIRTIRDLAGKRVAFADRLSTTGYVLPLYMLYKANLKLSDLAGHDWLPTHEDVALAVLMGRYDAGAVKDEVALDYEEKGLRVVEWSPATAEYLFAAKAGIDPELSKCIGNALLAIPSAPEGVKLLQALKKRFTGIGAVADSDYDSLRAIMTETQGMEGRK
jgi:phosphonate transport system substrate-binding protein